MASIGHIALGMAAGRALATRRDQALRWMVWFVAVSCAADLDLGLLVAGLPTNTIWGHRGFTHSLGIALLAGVASAGLARRWGQPAGRWAMMGFLSYASHLLLDCLNVGSRGVPWLWPVTESFHRLPWAPIPAVERATDFLTRAAVPVVAAEILLFAPFWIYALVVPWSSGPGPLRASGAALRGSWLARRRRIEGAVE